MIHEIMYDPSFLDFMVSFELYDFGFMGFLLETPCCWVLIMKHF